MSTITLPYKWRIRAKACGGAGKDAFLWSADELEAALKANREQADECRRILKNDAPCHQQLNEIRAILERPGKEGQL